MRFVSFELPSIIGMQIRAGVHGVEYLLDAGRVGI
jgi:hypothetical protein